MATSRCARALGPLAALVVLVQAQPVSAFCRATTCGADPEDICVIGAHSCVIEGVPLSWPLGSTVLLTVDPETLDTAEGADAVKALKESVLAWTSAGCSDDESPNLTLEVIDAAALTDQDVEELPLVTVSFVAEDWPYELDAAGRTTLNFGTDTGWISGAAITLNAQEYALSRTPDEGEIDLTAVLTHELGHVLGLGHSDAEGATMSASAETSWAGKLKTLEDDDELGLCSLYPPESETVIFDLSGGGSGGEGGASDGADSDGEGSGCSLARPEPSQPHTWSSLAAVTALTLTSLRRRQRAVRLR